MKGAKSKGEAVPKKADNKLSVKKKVAKQPAKKEKADPNKPKRPPSAFFVFMAEFRKQFKEKHPDVNKVSVVGKAGGEKWKSLSKSEKAPYESKAAKLKTEYTKKMDAYNNQGASGRRVEEDDEDGASDKSKSEVNDEEDESGEEDDDDDDEDDD